MIDVVKSRLALLMGEVISIFTIITGKISNQNQVKPVDKGGKHSYLKNDVYNYWMYEPDSSLDKYPIIVFLHGADERKLNKNKPLKWGPPKY